MEQTNKEALELKAAMRTALEANGSLDPVKAQLRAAVFHALSSTTADAKTKPPPSAEALLVHELIRDYLQFAGFEHTLSVFSSEAALAPETVPRRLLANELGVAAAPPDVPVIFAMMAEGANQTE